jgi:serine/threonine protein kinase
LLRKLKHENIIRLYEVYESPNNIHMILELLEGGELFDKIKKKVLFKEIDVKIIMRSILLALEEVHSKNMVHRDLKPENLIFAHEDLSTVKITDFGLSTKFKGGKIFLRCGSPGYVAPEILNDEGYD